jgi:VacB/RNase II family 3'-5' exoribonuclease
MRQAANSDHQDRSTLERIARRAMLERGLFPDFSSSALAQLAVIQTSTGRAQKPARDSPENRDLTALPWASIDNNDSRDLDQVTVAATSGGKLVIRVAIADVDCLVPQGSAIDEHARGNTTSVYTAACMFPMLPEKLSTDLTSLGLNAERPAVVVDMEVGADGTLLGSDVFQARVRNHAKLAYDSVAAWLEGGGNLPDGIASVDGLADNLRLQDRTAQSMKRLRHVHGALSLDTHEATPVFDGNQIRGLEIEEKNRARELIEDFMIAANGVTARYLASKGFPSIRRVVRTPKRWDRLVEVAKEHGFTLPAAPDSGALEEFLVKQKAADPVRFPDLSLVVIKLLGAGEYIAERPGETAPGHFGLAVREYAHSTAPNRRYADLVAQRLLKSAIAGRAAPYRFEELDRLARHLTKAEDAVNKVERQVGKSAAALLLQSRIGEEFDGIVTGASEKGTWARLLSIPVEGRVSRAFEGCDVGGRVRLRLLSVDVERGYIDFEKIGS